MLYGYPHPPHSPSPVSMVTLYPGPEVDSRDNRGLIPLEWKDTNIIVWNRGWLCMISRSVSGPLGALASPSQAPRWRGLEFERVSFCCPWKKCFSLWSEKRLYGVSAVSLFPSFYLPLFHPPTFLSSILSSILVIMELMHLRLLQISWSEGEKIHSCWLRRGSD